MHLLITMAWYSTWPSIVSDLHNHTNSALRPQHAMQTEASMQAASNNISICTEDVTAVRCTLQRLQMCSRDSIASSTWNECQPIDIFFSLLAASTCCHRGRDRCETVIYACLQPTQGLCLKADLNFCVRPSGMPPLTTHSEGLLLRVGTLTCAPTYNRGVVQHVVFNRFGLAQPHECSLTAATCHANSTYCTSGLQRHLIICTEDVNCCSTHVAKATDLFSGHDCISLVEQL